MSEICIITVYKKYYDIIEKTCQELMEYGANDGREIIDKYNLYEYIRGKDKIIAGDKEYIFHGAGCTVFENGELVADWDFGYRSWWCGIEPYKLARTLKNTEYANTVFCNGDKIKEICEEKIEEGLFYKYKNQYYINLLKLGTKANDIPKEYDVMKASFGGKKREFLKSEAIDRFLEKASVVYKEVENLKNNYVLEFYYKGRLNAQLLYNNIAYYDKAVEIMDKEILKPHELDLWKN